MVRMSDSRVVGRPWNRGRETDWVKMDLAIEVNDDYDDDDWYSVLSMTVTSVIEICSYEVPGMILLRDLQGAMRLLAVNTCLCMFKLETITISTH